MGVKGLMLFSECIYIFVAMANTTTILWQPLFQTTNKLIASSISRVWKGRYFDIVMLNTNNCVTCTYKKIHLSVSDEVVILICKTVLKLPKKFSIYTIVSTESVTHHLLCWDRIHMCCFQFLHFCSSCNIVVLVEVQCHSYVCSYMFQVGLWWFDNTEN